MVVELLVVLDVDGQRAGRRLPVDPRRGVKRAAKRFDLGSAQQLLIVSNIIGSLGGLKWRV